MRKGILFLVFISLLACNQKTERRDTNIEYFEEILGKKETSYLNEIVDDLDSYLALHYPEKKSKFKAYLLDISKGNTSEYWSIDSIEMKHYKESKLFGQYDTIFPDSVYYDGTSFHIRYTDCDFVEQISFLKRKNKEINIDSTIKLLKNEPKFSLREQSKFYIALDAIPQPDSLIISYIEAKQAAGNFRLSTLAAALLNYLTEKNEYFAKRIFIMDIYER